MIENKPNDKKQKLIKDFLKPLTDKLNI